MTQPAIAPWWRLAREAIEAADWQAAEGALRRLDSLAPGQPQVLDLLSYTLLMQGQFSACEAVLRAALAGGGCSFWTPHKLGDALRGQQRMEEAIAAYEQALSWGSDSPLTARNLLQVLDGLDPARAVARLEGWAAPVRHGADSRITVDWQQPPPWITGACEAACTSIGPDLAQWLHTWGCPDPEIRRLALEAALLGLDLERALPLAHGPLGQRLRQLLGTGLPLQQP
ncbi:MAG: hypothetical protein VKM97_01745 [Cyanobacteriota bacterium]|nr:hypothetical protein [Cyanobacteriota bacterium]